MLDIQFIRDNPELVAQKAKEKNIELDITKLLADDEARRELTTQAEGLRQERNQFTESLKGQKPSEDQISTGKALREKIDGIEGQLAETDESFNELLSQVPNVHPDDTPQGGEEANKPEKHVGEAAKKDVKDHLTWGEEKSYLDFERGAKVAGSKFYYTKGPLVELEYACIQLALSLAIKHGFTPITVPHMVNEKTGNGTGYSPRGEEDQIYSIAGEDLSLIATAEIPITGYHAGEILDLKELPLLYVGISPAYRKEAGAYGKHSKGLYRVHQFNKVEMYIFCEGELEESEKWHKKLIDIEEELCAALEIPYELSRIAAGDLGAPAYKKYDINYWSPVEGQYRELMSCSNVTDYQSRRLKIRYKNIEGKTQLVHTLNGTAMAFSRVAIALIENHQNKDGSVTVPRALQPFMSGKQEIA
jgi:seryl-tRNA synthetase